VREAYQKSAEGKASKKKTGAHRKQVKSMIPLTEQERQQLIILERDRLHLTETTGIQHHLDHIMPLSKGGIHHPINLRIITAEENISKGDKVTPEAMALIPQIQAIVNERKGWLNTEQDSTLADLFTTTEDET
jgi:5-methylcytosine-specific restriction endonuclease McrA